jgi:amidohydrolase
MYTRKRIIYLLLLCSIIPLSAQGQITNDIILQRVEETNNDLKALRCYLHEYPELSGNEFETTKFLQAEIAKLGLPVTKVPGTGFYAVLDTRRPGKTIGLRADIDALPIPENENNLKRKKYCVSKNAGVSHTCGHDGHMAILLVTARILTELQAQLNGKIVFIFEEGEESNSGIDAMVEALKALKIDAVYGNHLKSSLNTGEIYIQEGAVMAGTGTVAFDVIGKGGHASRPDLSINPVFAAANILTGISIAWNNQRDITETVTLGITQVQAGEVYNVIPNTAFIGGTIRFFDRAEAEKCFDIIRNLSENIAAAHRCTVKFRETNGIVLNPVVNAAALTQFTREAVRQIYPDRVVSGDQYIWYAAETFSKYSRLAPTVFVFAGIKNEVFGSGAEHHNDRFDIDDNALRYAVGAMIKVTAGFLE